MSERNVSHLQFAACICKFGERFNWQWHETVQAGGTEDNSAFFSQCNLARLQHLWMS